MISKNTTIVIFTLALVAVFAGLGWYYFAIQKETTETPTVSENVTSPPIQATTTLETKIYRNDEWRFEFQYPENWEFEENYTRSYYSKFNLRVMPINEKHTKIPVVINIVLSEFAESSFRGIEKTTSEVVIDEIAGIKYEYEFGGRQEIAIILPLKEYKIILGTDDKQYKEIFNQIFASFKFLK